MNPSKDVGPKDRTLIGLLRDPAARQALIDSNNYPEVVRDSLSSGALSHLREAFRNAGILARDGGMDGKPDCCPTPFGRALAYNLLEYDLQVGRRDVFRSLDWLQIRQGHSVLDIGCGAGQTLLAAGSYLPSVLAGVDYDIESLRLIPVFSELYSSPDAPELNCVLADAHRLPFDSGQFDRLLSRVTLYLLSVRTAIQEMRRVMRTGGRAFIRVPSFGACLSRLRANLLWPRRASYFLFWLANGLNMILFGRQMEVTSGTKIVRSTLFSRFAICRLLRRGGFEVLDLNVERWGPFTASLEILAEAV